MILSYFFTWFYNDLFEYEIKNHKHIRSYDDDIFVSIKSY